MRCVSVATIIDFRNTGNNPRRHEEYQSWNKNKSQWVSILSLSGREVEQSWYYILELLISIIYEFGQAYCGKNLYYKSSFIATYPLFRTLSFIEKMKKKNNHLKYLHRIKIFYAYLNKKKLIKSFKLPDS